MHAMVSDVRLADGMEEYIALVRATSVPTDLEGARLHADLAAKRFQQPLPEDVEVSTTFVPLPGREITARIYRPAGADLRPGICYLHGGGFAYGSIETFDVIAAALAHLTRAVVVSVHYRRLPDTDYAGAQDDCNQMLGWMARQATVLGIDAGRIAIAGDSAGALLATTAAAYARDNDGPALIAQILLYGAFAMDVDRPAYQQSRDPMLTADRIRTYIELFRQCGGTDDQPAPVDRLDLAGLPAAFVLAAEFDPLAQEAAEYADALRASGVPVWLRTAPGMIHGFLRGLTVSSAAREELAALVKAFSPLFHLQEAL